MSIIYKGKVIHFFSTAPKDLSSFGDYTDSTRELISLSAATGFNGILTPETILLASFDPWVYSHEILCRSDELAPIIALNPASADPWIAAKRIINLTHLYNRRICLNFIAGALNIKYELSATERYERLDEYIHIITTLLSENTPLYFTGKYYQLSGIQLPVQLSAALQPIGIISGESDAVIRMASKYDLFRLTVFNESYKSSIDVKTWFAVGVATGETTDEVECFIEHLTVEDPRAQFLLKYAAQTLNDSVWKKNLYNRMGNISKNISYALYKNQISSLPYLVGTYSEIAKLLYDSIVAGVEGFIIELPIITPDEFKKFGICLDYLSTKLER
ncbi:alkanesulfonate monooxygenase [Pedobacter sp. AK017]|uniref:LLM class flavin-dependent oxidoreductase n=1 Tax=Pedobacter sp. AK017 TaxID=2723073 RepID=UPI00160EFF2E|nr:LLM class flavin-dependent oxidoreductase [Pedobacter sp. AK017]MBB5441226.1 alkanesulfonate monooxygenase [Pedobacter sp. AK017]